MASRFLRTSSAVLGCLAASAAMVLPCAALAATGDAGSSKASTSVRCTDNTERKVNGWIRSCQMVVTQTFNRVQTRDPDGSKPPTTVPLTCRRNMWATFDGLGYITACTNNPPAP